MGFVRDGKNQNCMAAQNSPLELTDAMQNKACRPQGGCTRVYVSTCMHSDVNKTGKKLFALNRGFQ